MLGIGREYCWIETPGGGAAWRRGWRSCVAPRTADLRVVAGGGIVARMMFADWRPPAGIAVAPAGARARIAAWRQGRP
jgi:hypothetical protein